MSLTTGRGPLSANPAGHFSAPVPSGVVYVEPFLRRVRARSAERVVIDSERVLLVHRPGQPPAYAFPQTDVQPSVVAEPEPAAAGYVRVRWDAVSTWYEEDEQVSGHPRNPYHRVDCVRTRRRLRVELAGIVLVDTADAADAADAAHIIGVYESSRLPQLYVRREAVKMEHLVASPTRSYCPYKGTASYWSAVIDDQRFADVAWSYDDPLPECTPIAGMLSFYPERATVTQDILTWFVAPTAAAATARSKDDGSHG